jgi:hypothetical protein
MFGRLWDSAAARAELVRQVYAALLFEIPSIERSFINEHY